MLLQRTKAGLYCNAGDFYVDPTRRVKRAVVTHAHSDHARPGSERYLAVHESKHLLRMRLGQRAMIKTIAYGESLDVGGVKVSFHPAGHMLGSAQVRIEHKGEVAVVTGDYKLGDDFTCATFQPVKCHLLVTESTFAIPVYRWRPQTEVFAEINDWWRRSASLGKTCVLHGYAIGKSQRLLSGLDPSVGDICTYGAVEKGVQAYRATGVGLPATVPVTSVDKGHDFAGSMVIAVPSADDTTLLRRLGDVTTAMASGWMQIRGNRRRRNVDRGFVLSDHVDWPEFLKAVELCEPEEVWVTHGYSEIAARYLTEQGIKALSIETRHGSEDVKATEETPAGKVAVDEDSPSDGARQT